MRPPSNPIGQRPVSHRGGRPGYKVVFERIKDYWARDLNFAAGHFNFDEVEVIWFFDKRVMLQALRAGVFDYYFEENESDWATSYDFEGYRRGLFKKETYTMGFAYGMHFGTVLNTRRAPLDDIRVREALTLAYNFEWANRVFWHDGMNRNNSFFVRSGMQAFGPPPPKSSRSSNRSAAQLPESVFTTPIELPKNHPFGRNRETLLRADALLEEAGWVVKDFQRVNAVTGRTTCARVRRHPSRTPRMLTPFVENLSALRGHYVVAQDREQRDDQPSAQLRLRCDRAQGLHLQGTVSHPHAQHVHIRVCG